MFLRQHYVLMDKAGDTGEGGSSGGSENDDKKSDTGGDDDKNDDVKAKLARLAELEEENKTLLNETMSRKQKLKEARTQSEETVAELKKLQEAMQSFGEVTPEEVQNLLSEKRQAEEKKKQEEEGIEAWKNGFIADFNEKLESTKKELSEENADLKRRLKERDQEDAEMQISKAFVNNRYARQSLDISPEKAERLWGDHVELDEDNELVWYDKPSGSKNRKALVDSTSGRPLSSAKALEKIVLADPDGDRFIKSDTKPGSQSKKTDHKSDKTPAIGRGVSRMKYSRQKARET